ncbi:protein COP1 SUPPRESSOR 2 [Juglans microcarpa x Juglans regia]|uniref:protein COP1 SUPPRESSOR 2 n=1 Tax=Juglans microcarpa x Juglans regia TaxID=2249226 RepID=UPI001B7E308D|nr:protein COP1 SUPPRESSOR 2 [Juglans microcarpa x Juglans regia]
MQEAKKKKKNFRKSGAPIQQQDESHGEGEDTIVKSDDEQERRMVLEEVKFLQKQRERKSGIPAVSSNASSSSSQTTGGVGAGFGLGFAKVGNNHGAAAKTDAGGATDAEKEDLVLHDNFAQETAVMVEDPNMVKYVEQELAKKRGRTIDSTDQAENDLKRAEDELYKIPDHLKVKRRNSEESSTQWTTGIAEIQLPIEYKLRNIEETEAAKKLLQEKRLMGRTKSEFTIPASYSADYFQRGRDYAEKLRREHPELYKDRSLPDDGAGSKQNETTTDGAVQRQAATDEFMLDRFRKRERHRVMRR